MVDASPSGHDDEAVMHRSNPADCSALYLTLRCLALDTM